MTREELIEIIRKTDIDIIHHALSGSSGEPSIGYDGACITADHILAIIAKEKDGEVVLGRIEKEEAVHTIRLSGVESQSMMCGGEVIFRPGEDK